MMNRKWILICSLALVLVSVILYKDVVDYDFVNLDDETYVYENLNIREINAKNLKTIFLEPYFVNYQPLAIMSYAFDYKFSELNAKGFHLTNVIIHVINAILVLFLLHLITGNVIFSLTIALIFAVHPVQVETVAWISERKGLLCTLFYLLSFMSYIKFSRGSKKGFYILSIILLILALLAKPMAVTLPLILILYDYYENKLCRKKLIEKVPFFIISIAFSLLVFFIQKNEGSVATSELMSFSQNILMAFYNVGFYIDKLMLPRNLSVFYAHSTPFSYISLKALIGQGMIVACILYLVNFKRINRGVNFGILFFLISLLPIIRLVPIGATYAADRYMYVPMLGLFFALGMIIISFQKARPESKVRARAFFVIIPIFIVCLSMAAVSQTKVWKNSYTLWSKVVAIGDPSDNAYLGLGKFHSSKEEYGEAVKYFLKVEKSTSPLWREMALFNLGLCYFKMKNYDESRAHLLTLTKDYPETIAVSSSDIYMLLARTSAFMNFLDDADKYFKRSLGFNPKNVRAHYYYALLFESIGNDAKAKEHFDLSEQYNKK
ncbi:tetratricopeptide repeat protein [Thermodesulfobacteriota bacterium]